MKYVPCNLWCMYQLFVWYHKYICFINLVKFYFRQLDFKSLFNNEPALALVSTQLKEQGFQRREAKPCFCASISNFTYGGDGGGSIATPNTSQSKVISWDDSTHAFIQGIWVNMLQNTFQETELVNLEISGHHKQNQLCHLLLK